eukprot:4075978-Pyramimonas_sp.AAC.1
MSLDRRMCIGEALRPVPPTPNDDDDVDVGQTSQGCLLGSLRSALGCLSGVILEPLGGLLGGSWGASWSFPGAYWRFLGS